MAYTVKAYKRGTVLKIPIEEKHKYYLCCEHIGQENKHYHIYVQYDNPKKLAFKKLHGCHVEKSYGSAQQNMPITYNVIMEAN